VQCVANAGVDRLNHDTGRWLLKIQQIEKGDHDCLSLTAAQSFISVLERRPGRVCGFPAPPWLGTIIATMAGRNILPTRKSTGRLS
jgi:hypothetical protein